MLCLNELIIEKFKQATANGLLLENWFLVITALCLFSGKLGGNRKSISLIICDYKEVYYFTMVSLWFLYVLLLLYILFKSSFIVFVIFSDIPKTFVVRFWFSLFNMMLCSFMIMGFDIVSLKLLCTQ